MTTDEKRAAKAAYDKRRRQEHKEELLTKERAARAALTPEQRASRTAYQRAYREAHRERLRAQAKVRNDAGYQRDWNRQARSKDPELWRLRARIWRLKSKYGITIERYNEMLAEQRGVCAICGREETMQIKGTRCTLAVDHDAVTGLVRGLLCVNCNMLIGGARHDVSVLRGAIAYLDRYDGRNVPDDRR